MAKTPRRTCLGGAGRLIFAGMKVHASIGPGRSRVRLGRERMNEDRIR